MRNKPANDIDSPLKVATLYTLISLAPQNWKIIRKIKDATHEQRVEALLKQGYAVTVKRRRKECLI